MKRALIFQFILLLVAGISHAERVFGSDAEREAWEGKARVHIQKLASEANENSITELTEYVFKLNNQMKESETEGVLEEAHHALISIPGHALYYQNKIENIRSSYLNGSESTLHGYNDAIAAMGALKYVKSPESVAVLGHFLNNPEGRNGKMLDGGLVDGEDFSRTPPCVMAAAVLSEIGIDKPPSRGPLLYATKWQQIDAWKDWWNEIAAGKRTYRFVGSPVEYGANGPVSAKDLSRREHEQLSLATKTMEDVGNIAPNNRRSWTGALVGAGATFLMLLGAWFAFRRSKVANQ